MTEHVPADAYEAYSGPDRVAEARAVAGPEPPVDPVTTYFIHLDVFVSTPETTDANVAETWSRTGVKVTASTEDQR